MIKSTIELFEPHNQEVETILENSDPDDAAPEMWDQIAGQNQQTLADLQTENQQIEYPFLDPESLPSDNNTDSTKSHKKSSFSLTTNNLCSDDHYLKFVRQLNKQQRALFDYLF